MSLLLNTGAMHYRENVNDDWKPLVIKANADLTVLADEYSNASTYVVGEYCRYDGQLYRCTTAITTAESWTPAHWTETNIGDELESINDSYLPLTAGSNKALTGNLYIERDTSPIVLLINDLADVSSQTEEATRYWYLRFRDKDLDNVGAFVSTHTTTGRTTSYMAAYNLVNGEEDQNRLELRIDTDGKKAVSVTDPIPWRSALGLGTSGALPITIAQGGTGNTAVGAVTTASGVITAASGFTIEDARFYYWGKLAQIYVVAKKSTAQTAAATMTIGTVLSGLRPVIGIGLRWSATTFSYANLATNGSLVCYGTWPANTSISFTGTYILS